MGKPPKFIGRNSTTWAAPDGNVWLIEMDWAEINGRAECVGMALRSYAPRDPWGRPEMADGTLMPVGADNDVRPVRAEIVRRMTMAAVEDARQEWTEHLRDDRSDVDPPMGETWQEWRRSSLASFETPGGRVRKLVGADGEPLSPHDALVEVARVYRQAWLAGENPTQTVAGALGVTRSAAAKRVRRARDAGLLPETGQGRPAAVVEESEGD